MYQDIYNCIYQNTKKIRFIIHYVKPTAQLLFRIRFPKVLPILGCLHIGNIAKEINRECRNIAYKVGSVWSSVLVYLYFYTYEYEKYRTSVLLKLLDDLSWKPPKLI